jgi:HD-GYP domain-containing protein (c-di-GMP phosphodiesterase class II)
MGSLFQTPSSISVTPHAQGRVGGEKQVFLPLLSAFLLPGQVLKFDLYVRSGESQLEPFLSRGALVPADIRALLSRDPAPRFYVRADQRDALLEYQESVLIEILDADETPVEIKCEAVQQVTTSLSQLMFQNPTAININRQRRNIFRMVDFSLREQSAVKELFRLAHHDYYTYTHSVNVGLYGLGIALTHFRDQASHNIHEIVTSFFLHDIGKCRVSSDIINKPGPLDESEWQEMKKHPNYGFSLLEREQMLNDETGIVVLQHHERIDGRGYPKGLKGNAIHPYARICSIADAFDALTSRRAYRSGRSPFEALQIMKQEVDTQFDPTFYKLFVLQLQKSATGSSVWTSPAEPCYD